MINIHVQRWKIRPLMSGEVLDLLPTGEFGPDPEITLGSNNQAINVAEVHAPTGLPLRSAGIPIRQFTAHPYARFHQAPNGDIYIVEPQDGASFSTREAL